MREDWGQIEKRRSFRLAQKETNSLYILQEVHCSENTIPRWSAKSNGGIKPSLMALLEIKVELQSFLTTALPLKFKNLFRI